MSKIFTTVDHSLYQYIENMNDTTSLDVMNFLSSGKTIRWYNFIGNPCFEFLKKFIFLREYKNGIRGLVSAYYCGLSVLVLLAKSWEYQTANKRSGDIPPVTAEAISTLKNL